MQNGKRPSAMDDRQIVRTFVRSLAENAGHREDFADGDLLASTGVLQSVDLLEIVLFLEERYGVDFGIINLDRSEIESVDRILEFIASHRRR
jgi:acyl carrier protein